MSAKKSKSPRTAATHAPVATSSQSIIEPAGQKPDRASKQSRVIAMLQSPDGATIDAIMEATGWQQHSVRGFLAGVVRKKLKLKLSSTKVDDHRLYRIDQGSGHRAGGRPSKRRAA
jgi:hypothetical protein